jgi:N-acetylglutamate synthase-like GNAT family acetyltransferase
MTNDIALGLSALAVLEKESDLFSQLEFQNSTHKSWTATVHTLDHSTRSNRVYNFLLYQCPL